MNNIEELKAAATAMRLSSTMRITDEIITFRRLFTPDCALALIAQLEAAQKELSAANEKLKVPIKLPKKIYLKSSRGNVISWSKTFDAIEAAGFTVEGEL